MTEYTMNELIAVCLARELKDNEVGFVGTGTGGRTFTLAVGIPLVAARLAQLTHAPNFCILIGSLIDPCLDQIPETFGEWAMTNWKASARIAAADNLDILTKGGVDVGFTSGAQIDEYGNLNITSIGNYFCPKVRLIGCLALPELLAFAKKPIVIMDQNRRSFIKRVDFVTGAGYSKGENNTEQMDLGKKGPWKIITDKTVLGFNKVDRRMKIESIHPGVSLEQVKESTEFDLVIPSKAEKTAPPPPEQVQLIRKKIDVNNVLLKY